MRGDRRRVHRAYASLICIALLAALAAAAIAAPDAQPSALPGGWHLTRIKNPNGGSDAISVGHTADVGRSDIELAGILFRCGEAGIEMIVVVVTPFSPRAQPEVTVRAKSQEWRFKARVVPPGAELLLPAEAMHLAFGSWQSAQELAIKVVSQEQSFGGTVSVGNMAEAVAALAAICTPGLNPR